MKVKIAIIDDTIVIAKIEGKFCIFDDEFDLFAKEMVAYTKMGVYQFLLDLKKVSYIDSSGVGLMIRLATNALKKGIRLSVVSDDPNVNRVLIVSNIDRIIRFADSIESGIHYLQSPVEVSK